MFYISWMDSGNDAVLHRPMELACTYPMQVKDSCGPVEPCLNLIYQGLSAFPFLGGVNCIHKSVLLTFCYFPTRFCSLVPVISAHLLTMCILLTQQYSTESSSDLGFTKDITDNTPPPSSQDSDTNFEAKSY